jgi:uncharacterized RDD family membrane protein YckC
MPKAGFLIRLQAYLIDLTLWLLTLIVPTWFIFSYFNNLQELIPAIGVLLYYSVFILPALLLLYRVILTTKFGGGIGKLVCGIKVTDENNKLLRFWSSAFRYIVGYFVSNLLFGLGFLWIARDKNKQGWHDQISGTFVYHHKAKRWIAGTVLLIILLFANSFLASNTVQLIKNNKILKDQIQSVIKEISTSVLENDETPATIEPQEVPYII